MFKLNNNFLILFTFLTFTTSLCSDNEQCEGDGKTVMKLASEIKIDAAGKKSISKWIDQIKDRKNCDDVKAKGILGEIVAEYLFANIGYKIIENQLKRYIGCVITTKASNKGEGIDGIFRHDSNPPIFNEAKFRSKGCKNSDLECTQYGQQASITWNSYHFAHLRDKTMAKRPECKGVNFEELAVKYSENDIIRSLTCLNKDGIVTLYSLDGSKQTQKVLNDLSEAKLDKKSFSEIFSTVLDRNSK